MRLMCTVNVINRSFKDKPVNQKRKHVKSTLALCKQPKTEEYCFLLFSSNNKNGTKYTIKNNIARVHTRFVVEGKATIQFKEPDHDICIQAEVIPLKAFLHFLKCVLENKNVPASSMSIMPLKKQDVAPKKLVILRRGEYPIKGFPRTLEILQINDIQRCGLDRGILQLHKLRILDLSKNLIEDLPEEFNKLPNLAELNLSHNQMGKSAPRQWDWLGGKLTKTLKLLNLSNNEMKFIPEQLVKLFALVSLHVNNNNIKFLPSGIGNLRNLRILTAYNNQLSSLPGTARKWRLDELDLSHNIFHEREQSNPNAIFPKPLPVCTLKEYAASKVLYARLYYDAETLPLTLIKYLEMAKYCVCGKGCFEYSIKFSHMLLLTSVSKNYSTTVGDVAYVPTDCHFCSLKCFSSANRNRPGVPLLR